METKEKTTLQKIMEQKAEQIRIAIEQAMDWGVKIEKVSSITSIFENCYIDGVFLQKRTEDGSLSLVLNFYSDKIAKIFEPTEDDLKKMAEQKRAELEEIEKQINAKQ